jgi:hypothetical protein
MARDRGKNEEKIDQTLAWHEMECRIGFVGCGDSFLERDRLK